MRASSTVEPWPLDVLLDKFDSLRIEHETRRDGVSQPDSPIARFAGRGS